MYIIFSFLLALLVVYVGAWLVQGEFREWVIRRFFVRDDIYYEHTGRSVTYDAVQWGNLRSFLVRCAAFGTAAVVLLVELVSDYRMKRRTRKVTEEIASMAGILSETEDISNAPEFPAAYAEIETKLVQMKAGMQRQRQLADEEAMRRNDLITWLAHDLKTPLTSVIGYLSLLDEADDMPKEQRVKYTKVALDKAYRLESLINEFFDITRYNLQTVVLEKEKTDLYYMLVQMAEEFYPLLSPEGKRIVIHAPENMQLYGDVRKLARVFNNVLKNAVHYSYPDSTIDIFAENSRDKTVIIFRNEGKCIPKEKLELIFERFFRLDEARTTNSGGAGLGLAIAREIVTRHGGTIYADSNEQYTIFVVELPISEAAVSAAGDGARGKENLRDFFTFS